MNTLRGSQTPALDWLLADEPPGGAWTREQDGTPFECCHCPFGTPETRYHEPANSADLAEGYYECRLLSLYGPMAVWGEQPKCKPEDWRLFARRELAEVREPRERRGSSVRSVPSEEQPCEEQP